MCWFRIKEGTCLTRDKCQLSAHVILYVEPTIISVQNDTNAMLYCKVIGGTIRVVLCFSWAKKLGKYWCHAFSITPVKCT